ncbi:hypothetical protein LUZ61_001154 [Rhynchospora tenuis]|uniref:Nudix hydrolase domain-containing protein n=1 Tax=Rhynchospora tenuis TaxID=198213 RepID=A0AAD6EQI7_9POAL|nr:hypothetical protein LUZ61_001154 [Rhynchospora tenuis]
MVAKMVTLVSRQGRELQRYSSTGGRIVVGCIPYRVNGKISCSDDVDKVMEVLVISSQKGNGMMFPKGGWELDETVKEAASREALEEAGVQGKIERRLGKWNYMSKSHNIFYEGILYPLNVTDEMAHWPEMQVRNRRWVAVAEAREGCPHQWMIEALDRLLNRLKKPLKKRKTSACGF